MSSTTKTKTSPLVPIAGLLVLLCAGLATLKRGPALDSAADEIQAPALTPAEAPRCSVVGPAPVLDHAREAEHEALAKREQFPFEPADGVAALRLFAEASACFADGDDSTGRDRTLAALRDWEAVVSERYAALRLRLQVAQTQHRDADALETVRELERLLQGRSGPYLDWLAELREPLERQAGADGTGSRAR